MVANTLVALIALAHVWFLVLEMFLWQKPLGLKTFQQTPEMAASTAVLAANQGLYNGFLVAGLVWSLTLPSPFALSVKTFFLACVLVAGVYGGATAKRTILYIQGLPAAIALLVLYSPWGP